MLTAGQVGISPDLVATFNGIGNKSVGNIGNNYTKQKSQFDADQLARGGVPSSGNANSYAGQRFNTQQGLDIGNLNSGLEASLGNTGYQDALSKRAYDQQMEIAREISAANRPSLLTNVFQGVGSVGGAAGKFYGLYGNKGQPQSYGGGYPDQGSLSLSQGFGGNRYGYGAPDPNAAFGGY